MVQAILLFKLLCGHALADFALQPEVMAKGKNRNLKPEYIPKGQRLAVCWPYWLTAHALIHGGAVYLITGSIFLGIFETVVHWILDFMKSDNYTTVHQDQFFHFAVKLAYLA